MCTESASSYMFTVAEHGHFCFFQDNTVQNANFLSKSRLGSTASGLLGLQLQGPSHHLLRSRAECLGAAQLGALRRPQLGNLWAAG